MDTEDARKLPPSAQKEKRKLAIRTVGQYLQRWGFTPQKPIKHAYEQNPKAVQQWLDEDYPQIHTKAKEEGFIAHAELQKQSHRVAKYFQHRKIKYAA